MSKKKNEKKLSKKEQRIAEALKLERKAAKLRKATEKGMKKAKVKSAEDPTGSAATVTGAVEESARHPHLQHLDRVGELVEVVENPESSKKDRKAAQAELDTLRAEGEKLNAEKSIAEQDAEMRERIQAKRAARAATEPGSQERLRKMQEEAEGRRKSLDNLTLADVTPAETEAAPAETEAAPAETEAAPAETDVTPAETEAAPAETEAAPEAFGKPSEAPATDFETNGLGQYKIKLPENPEGMKPDHPDWDPRAGKIVGYTRVTTYIDTLEDKSALAKWKMRILLEGVAIADTPDADGKSDPVTARVRDLVHNRDLAIAKARKADRKGKLGIGELAPLIDAAWGTFKKALDALADEVFEVGGGREKAQKGTDIHALCDLYDSEGIDAVQDKLDAGEITPADFADVEAYARACKEMGLEVMESELVVVNDDLKVAGRLDRIVRAKLPEIRDPKTGEVIRVADARARRYVADIKTGRIDYGAGKIAQQIRMYAESTAYDLNTHERRAHGANRSVGLLIHLPAGAASAEIRLVDLAVGAIGNKLSGEVRAYRNAGRKAISPVNLAAPKPPATETGGE